MAKQQSRRTLSVRGDTYRKVREAAAAKGCSMSDFVERALAEAFGVDFVVHPHPQPVRLQRRASGKPRTRVDSIREAMARRGAR